MHDNNAPFLQSDRFSRFKVNIRVVHIFYQEIGAAAAGVGAVAVHLLIERVLAQPFRKNIVQLPLGDISKGGDIGKVRNEYIAGEQIDIDTVSAVGVVTHRNVLLGLQTAQQLAVLLQKAASKKGSVPNSIHKSGFRWSRRA